MNPDLRAKLEDNLSRHKDITDKLSTPEVYSNQSQMKSLNQELTKLEPSIKLFQKYLNIEKSILDTKELLHDEDKEMIAIARQELRQHEIELKNIESKIIEATVEKDPNDSRDIFMEIRAGTGGEEAAIFAGDLFKMYTKFSEKNKWRIEIINSNISDHGGFKEIIFKIIGDNVYSSLKYESGTHRVQRVPETETQGRVHTSASTVAVLPIVEQVDDIEINPADLRIDTYRASGAGGQHVNKTDSAVRITHLPTNIIVQCQNQRSQLKNKNTAMKMLKSKIYQKMLDDKNKDLQELSDSKMDNAWGSQIRSYVFHPYNLIKDHRTDTQTSNISSVLDGDIDMFIKKYLINNMEQSSERK